MYSTQELLVEWSKRQQNRCKPIPELGPNTFAIYIDGNHQIINIKNGRDPDLTPVEQAMLCRSLMQAICYKHSLTIETVRKHRLVHQVWVTEDEAGVSGFAEEVDLCSALLRSYIVCMEKEELAWEERVLKEGSMFDDGSYYINREHIEMSF